MNYENYFKSVRNQIFEPHNTNYLSILKIIYESCNQSKNSNTSFSNEFIFNEFLSKDENKKMSKNHFYKLLSDLERMALIERSYSLSRKKDRSRQYAISKYNLNDFGLELLKSKN